VRAIVKLEKWRLKMKNALLTLYHGLPFAADRNAIRVGCKKISS
jgi:hypothetical protein